MDMEKDAAGMVR